MTQTADQIEDDGFVTVHPDLREFQAAKAVLQQQLDAARDGIIAICGALPASREVSIARTNLETGFLWLEQAVRGVALK